MSLEYFIKIARGAVGLHAGDAAFRALVGPGENAAMQAALETKSTCALFVRGCLAKALIDSEAERLALPALDLELVRARVVPARLWAPYIDGMAVGDLVTLLSHAGRDPGRITRGSIVIVGEGRGTHVFVIESVERDGWPDGSYELIAIEAGQRDAKGRQHVVRRKHEVVGGFECAYEQERPGGTWVLRSSARRVTHVLDPRRLLEGSAA